MPRMALLAIVATFLLAPRVQAETSVSPEDAYAIGVEAYV